MIACIAEAWKVSLVNPILSWHVLLSGRTGTLEHRNTQKTRNTTYNPEHPPENSWIPPENQEHSPENPEHPPKNQEHLPKYQEERKISKTRPRKYVTK